MVLANGKSDRKNEEIGGIGMDTKETIEKINLLLNLKSLYNHSNAPNYARIIDECIDSLQRGEKFEKMWKELYNQFVPYNSTQKISLKVSNRLNWDDLMKYVMNEVEQKYFPKEADTNETEMAK